MHHNSKFRILALVIGASVATIGCASTEEAPTTSSAGGSSITGTPIADANPGNEDKGTKDPGSSKAPYTDKYNFKATTFDGETFELAVHKGTPVVINFWESW